MADSLIRLGFRQCCLEKRRREVSDYRRIYPKTGENSL